MWFVVRAVHQPVMTFRDFKAFRRHRGLKSEVDEDGRPKVAFLEKDPLRANLQKCFPKGFTVSQIYVLCTNCVKFGRPEIDSRALSTGQKIKISVSSAVLASVRIAPKICQGQLQTIYTEYPKFHRNPYTPGGVIAGRVNIVETCHKVFPILGKASSPRNKTQQHN